MMSQKVYEWLVTGYLRSNTKGFYLSIKAQTENGANTKAKALVAHRNKTSPEDVVVTITTRGNESNED